MNSFKLFVVFTLLFFRIFAQRFQRHLINGTKNGYIYGNTEMDNLDALSSDGENAVKFVRNGEEAELELKNKELMFQFCSDGCMDKEVVACFDSTDSNSLRQGDCNPGQCEFRAGVKKVDEKNYLWFKSSEINFKITDPNGVCAIATMAFPYASSTLTDKFSSCEPLKHDGNVVKLYVIQAPLGCPLYVLNAKKWTPPPPTTTTQNSSALTETNQTTSKSSEANTALWIGIGGGIFILIIVVIGFGYCCYRTQIQKKPFFGKQKGVHQNDIIPEASKKAIVKEINEDKKEVVVSKPESTKEATKEESTVTKEKQPAKIKLPKKKKAIVVVSKPSKELTQENGTNEDAPSAKKSSIEPTFQDTTTDASVVQKSVQQKHRGNPPKVFGPKKVILPAKNSDGFKSVSILDTLSGAEDGETQHSTTEKSRKNEFAGRKKGSKKHR